MNLKVSNSQILSFSFFDSLRISCDNVNESQNCKPRAVLANHSLFGEMACHFLASPFWAVWPDLFLLLELLAFGL